jgi:hypothetical protein
MQPSVYLYGCICWELLFVIYSNVCCYREGYESTRLQLRECLSVFIESVHNVLSVYS